MAGRGLALMRVAAAGAAAAAAVASLGAAPAAALDFPDIDIDLPHLATGSPNEFQQSGQLNSAFSGCSPQNLSRYPSGWPQKLDWGIYWFGPNGEFKRAQPRQQVALVDPTSWFDKGDGYSNSTERWNNEFYDPSRNTVIYFHGWSGTGAWSTNQCRRITGTCGDDLCPPGEGQDLIEPWLKKGWNVGYFYWDQFADEHCMRDAEQKIWFDRKGNGLRWKSYNPENNTETWQEYLGSEESVADLCVTAVKEAMGDFYSGGTVRFVGRSIGSQLAVACAAKLHELQHVAAPQRLALLDPFFTQKEFSFLGTGVRCGQLTYDAGIGGFTQVATTDYVKVLWQKKRVATEVYALADIGDDDDDDVNSEAAYNLNTFTVRVNYKTGWCDGKAKSVQCQHRAVFPLYFLSKGLPPPPLVATTPAVPGVVPGGPLTLNEQAETEGPCEVPSASCSDAQLRALVEQHVDMVLQREATAAPPSKQVWEQVAGSATFELKDDTFAAASPQVLRTITPDPSIEEEVADSNAMKQRDWGLHRSWTLGTSAGLSLEQRNFFFQVLGYIVLIPIVAFVTYRVVRFASDRQGAGGGGDSDEDEEEEDEDSDLEKSRGDSPTSSGKGRRLLKVEG